MTVILSTEAPFARGGNRLCFVHPDFPDRVIKVRRPDFSLSALRQKKGFPKNLKPLSAFDDNIEEFRVMQDLHKRIGNSLYEHAARCYGFEITDMGKGLVSDLIRDENGKISYSLKQYLWEKGHTDSFDSAIRTFCCFWEEMAIPSRDLLLHNIVAQCNSAGEVKRLVVIDGLGNPTLIPHFLLPLSIRRVRAKRKTKDLSERLNRYLEEIKSGKVPGPMGRLLHDGTSE